MRKSLYGLTVALITLPSTSALAGHYQAGPSIGLAITAVPPPPGTTSGPFVGSGTCSAGAGGGNGAAGVSGTISTTLSWVRDLDANGQPILSDVPPEKVAIWETCSVQSMGICYPGSPSATAQNGLDSRFSINVTSTVPQYVTLPFPPFQIQIGTMVESRSIGTAPRIVAGAESIQVTCSPTGSAAAANGPVSVAVDYSVWAEPVTLSVDNLTNQSECLIGQGHEGSLACPGLTLVGHSWILPDQVFKDFVVAADKTSATLFEIEFSDLTDTSPHWYWNTSGSKTVRCSANASYNGISLGTVSAKKLVDVWEPWTGYAVEHVSGQWYSENVDKVTTADPFCLPTDPMFENAIRWTGNVATPLRFVTSQGDHGMFAYLQLCKIDDFVIRLGGPQNAYSTHGRWDLDNRYFYYPNGGGMSPADTYENGTPIGNSLGPEDRPELGLPYGIYAITSWQMDNEFEMFQLYLPPGFDSRLVPLNSTQWSTFGDGGYPVIGPGETLVPGSWTSVFSHGRTYIHPEWTAVFSNS